MVTGADYLRVAIAAVSPVTDSEESEAGGMPGSPQPARETRAVVRAGSSTASQSSAGS